MCTLQVLTLNRNALFVTLGIDSPAGLELRRVCLSIKIWCHNSFFWISLTIVNKLSESIAESQIWYRSCVPELHSSGVQGVLLFEVGPSFSLLCIVTGPQLCVFLFTIPACLLMRSRKLAHYNGYLLAVRGSNA
jgi:hypothetical protein